MIEMELLILGIDAMTPQILFNNIDDYPNIKRLCDMGFYGDYDAYAYGYGSRDNWISLYTGLTPKQHGTVGNIYKETGEKPTLKDYTNLDPFWKVLNDHNIKVGMWKALVTTPPEKINGYMIGGEANFEIDGERDPYASTPPLLNKLDKNIEEYINFDIEKPPMPKKPEDFESSWDEVFKNSSIADEILDENYFEESIAYFKKELEFYEENMTNVQRNNPVDVMFFYTPILDFIEHFAMHEESNRVVKKAMSILDNFVFNIIGKLNPKNVILMSDHGMTSLVDFFPNTPDHIQKEAFGWTDKSVWLKNGYLVTKARNGAFMSGIHSLKGCFIAAGDSIGKGKIEHMRTIDFYPTLLELFDIKVPDERHGYVQDVFSNKEIVNKEKVLIEEEIIINKIAIIQNIEIPKFNNIINEVFLDNRFAEINIIGERKYREILKGNPRVKEFYEIIGGKINENLLRKFDRVIIPFKNDITKELDYIEIEKDK